MVNGRVVDHMSFVLGCFEGVSLTEQTEIPLVDDLRLVMLCLSVFRAMSVLNTFIS